MTRKIGMMLTAVALTGLFALSALCDESEADMCPAIPFLAVTGRPSDADLARKVSALAADGFDQFLVYARSGLQYEYMGEDWMRCVDTLCREADMRGMKVWLYDEYNWPSGTCKGRVPEEHEDFRYTELAVFRTEGGGFRWQKALAPSGYVNVLDDGAMKRFLELTHKTYGNRFAKWFANKTIAGFFTDEPGAPAPMTFDGKPLAHFAWWSTLENEYRAMTGGDLRRDVEAFLDGTGTAAVWETYSTLKGRRFRYNYFDRIDSWCRSVGVLSTGHILEENSVDFGCRINGNPLHVLRGESLPAIDEIHTRTTGAEVEWLTLSIARHAVLRRGNGGAAELFACGPNDMPPDRMRQMMWLAALFGIDHYFLSMQVMDHRGLVEKHNYFSPVQEGQPWHREMRTLLDEAKKAAMTARRKDTAFHAAVRYPQGAAARCAYAGGRFPDVRSLVGALERLQLTVELIEEGEATDLPVVFAIDVSDADKDGTICEQRSGWRRFKAPEAAAEWLWGVTKKGIRYYELDGTPARDLVVREFADGSSVALDVRNGADRRLVAERHGMQVECTIPSRGIAVLGREEFPAPVASTAERAWTPESRSFAYELDRDNVIRLPFDTNGVARFTLSEPLELRLVLRACDERRSFLIDGCMLKASLPATSLPVEYNPLYGETLPFSIAAGEHSVRIDVGDADRNFFLPAAFLAGRIARRGGKIGRLPKTIGFGSLSDYGLGDYCGAVTYKVGKVVPATDTIRVFAGGLFVRVKWEGIDLGVRAFAPFDWKLPSAEPGSLEVTIYTPVVNILGDKDRKGSDWDSRFWSSPRDARYEAGLFPVMEGQK